MIDKEALKLALEKVANALPAYIEGTPAREYLAVIHSALAAPVQKGAIGAEYQKSPWDGKGISMPPPEAPVQELTNLQRHEQNVQKFLAAQPAPVQEPVAGQPLPCPFCGHIGLDFSDGETYRWGVASCGGCGASCGDVRREYPDQGEWHTEAIAEWNRRSPAAPDLQAELDATNRQVEILSDALAESRREVDALVSLARADERNRTWTQEHWTDYERSIAAAEREACAKTKAGKPRKLKAVGRGTLLGEQQFCFDKGWREGAASVRAAIRSRGVKNDPM